MGASLLVQPTARELSAGLVHLVEPLALGRVSTPTAVAELVAAADITRAELEPWVDFNYPVEDCYGRKMVATGRGFEILVMSWRPGNYSAIHDHGAAQCGAVKHFGRSDHLVYALDGEVLRIADEERMQPGAITPVAHDLIHQMGNPGDVPMVSLHVYVGRDGAAVTAGSRIFDLHERRVQRTDGGVFFCLPEPQITAREPGPRGDAATTAWHHARMLAHLRRVEAAGRLTPRLRARRDALQGRGTR